MRIPLERPVISEEAHFLISDDIKKFIVWFMDKINREVTDNDIKGLFKDLYSEDPHVSSVACHMLNIFRTTDPLSEAYINLNSLIIDDKLQSTLGEDGTVFYNLIGQ